MDPLRHQDIVEDPVVIELASALGRIGRVEPPAEIVRLAHPTPFRIDPLFLGHPLADEVVEAVQAQPTTLRMDVVVVVRGVEQEIAVIENADSGSVGRIREHGDKRK